MTYWGKFPHLPLIYLHTWPILCLKLCLFSQHYLEKEMHVNTLNGIVTMLFVLSPKERNKKPAQFFSDFKGGVKKRLTSGQVLALNTLHN